VQQKLLHVIWLSLQDFLNQVIDDIAITAREGGDKTGRVFAALQ
jgi:hypothetical protein